MLVTCVRKCIYTTCSPLSLTNRSQIETPGVGLVDSLVSLQLYKCIFSYKLYLVNRSNHVFESFHLALSDPCYFFWSSCVLQVLGFSWFSVYKLSFQC